MTLTSVTYGALSATFNNYLHGEIIVDLVQFTICAGVAYILVLKDFSQFTVISKFSQFVIQYQTYSVETQGLKFEHLQK